MDKTKQEVDLKFPTGLSGASIYSAWHGKYESTSRNDLPV
jgi:hypothetical protein